MAVLKHFMWAAPEFEPLNVALSKLALERDLLESAIPRVMITERTKPRLTRVLPRANWMDETGEIVQPAIPAFLGSLETGDRRANRLDLANWIVSRDNPLTARVVLDMYGAKPGEGSFASNCLLARRLAERGLRFIQLYHRNWDHHSGVKANVAIKAQETDQATAALIRDLKQRGMLDDTLVVWGGEFGRTPMSQGGDGRDHHSGVKANVAIKAQETDQATAALIRDLKQRGMLDDT